MPLANTNSASQVPPAPFQVHGLPNTVVVTYHDCKDVLRDGLGPKPLHGQESPAVWIKLEKPCASGICAAVKGVDQPLPMVLIRCADPKDFHSRRGILRDPHFIVALQELGPVLVDVYDVDESLWRRQHVTPLGLGSCLRANEWPERKLQAQTEQWAPFVCLAHVAVQWTCLCVCCRGWQPACTLQAVGEDAMEVLPA